MSNVPDLPPKLLKSIKEIATPKEVWGKEHYSLCSLAYTLDNDQVAQKFWAKVSVSARDKKYPVWWGILYNRNFLEGKISIDKLAEHDISPHKIIWRGEVPDDALAILAGIRDTSWVVALRQKTLTLKVQKALLGYDSLSALRLLVINPKLDVSLIGELVQHSDVTLRRDVAIREDLSVDFLRQLAFDNSEEIRLILAQKSNIPEDLFIVFARDSSPRVRKTLSQNMTIPEEIRIIAAL